MTKLLYRLVPHNGGAVFAEEERARYVVMINRALATAKTWGEFRSLMPAQEYEEIVARLEFEDDDQLEPDPDEKFDGIWLTEEGDYPPWLQSEMDLVIPEDILRRFGRRQTTFLNGSYWEIPEDQMEPMANALRARGFEVVKAQEFDFH